MDVGVRELKAHLSDYLDRAARGETIRVTDRGRPKAVLGPLPGNDAISRGIREGWITPPRVPHAPPAPRRRLAGLRPSAGIIAEDREE